MKAIAYGFLAMWVIAVAMVILAGIWKLWVFVMPNVCPTGPEGFIHPGYWAFVGMWYLFILIAIVWRGGKRR